MFLRCITKDMAAILSSKAVGYFYFDDAEKDLNILMYDEKENSFRILGDDYWERTKSFFGAFVKAA